MKLYLIIFLYFFNIFSYGATSTDIVKVIINVGPHRFISYVQLSTSETPDNFCIIREEF